jgi:hypothetical protein
MVMEFLGIMGFNDKKKGNNEVLFPLYESGFAVGPRKGDRRSLFLVD